MDLRNAETSLNIDRVFGAVSWEMILTFKCMRCLMPFSDNRDYHGTM
jgi:hypothetical protein